jgi:hypothetical protein
MRIFCTYFNFYRYHRGLKKEKEYKDSRKRHLHKNLELQKQMDIKWLTKLQAGNKCQLINRGVPINQWNYEINEINANI